MYIRPFHPPLCSKHTQNHFILLYLIPSVTLKPISVAARSKAWVCGRPLAAIAASNPTGHMEESFVSVVCC
jgi:hypothetical protein